VAGGGQPDLVPVIGVIVYERPVVSGAEARGSLGLPAARTVPGSRVHRRINGRA